VIKCVRDVWVFWDSEVAPVNFATKHLEQDLARLLAVSEQWLKCVCVSLVLQSTIWDWLR
jgi:hypothetical protein